MSLRARLAVALGILAAVAAAAVAVVGYQATRTQLLREVDASLGRAVQQLEGPAGRAAREFCDVDRGRRDQRPGRSPRLGENLPGLSIRCLTPAGTVVAQIGEFEDADRRVVVVDLGQGIRVELGRSTAEIERVLASLRSRYLILVGLVGLTAAAIGWAIAWQVTRPVRALTALTEQIATDGTLDREVPTTGDDEVGRLARSFASMLDALRRSRDQQQRLVQDAGHELRTPLTSLRANIDTLRRHPDLAGESRDRLLADLDSELRELSSLTEELVGLAADPSVDEPESGLDLAELARRCVDRARRRSGREILLEGFPSPMIGRARQLQRLIDNLVDNALKFSPPGTPVEVSVAPGRLEVRDHGPGIAEEDLPHLFERFYRSTAARSAPGSGLGLSIVAEIAARHGARVEAANAPDGGARLTVTFPDL
jgi:two-component system sensor histidine kinase MprB